MKTKFKLIETTKKFKRCKLKLWDGKEWFEVTGYRLGPLAYHLSTGDGYKVDHRPTGKLITTFPSEEFAQRFIRIMDQKSKQWDTEDVAYLSGRFKSLTKLVYNYVVGARMRSEEIQTLRGEFK